MKKITIILLFLLVTNSYAINPASYITRLRSYSEQELHELKAINSFVIDILKASVQWGNHREFIEKSCEPEFKAYDIVRGTRFFNKRFLNKIVAKFDNGEFKRILPLKNHLQSLSQ